MKTKIIPIKNVIEPDIFYNFSINKVKSFYNKTNKNYHMQQND